MNEVQYYPIEMMQKPDGDYELRHNKTAWLVKRQTSLDAAHMWEFAYKKALEMCVEFNSGNTVSKTWYPEANVTIAKVIE